MYHPSVDGVSVAAHAANASGKWGAEGKRPYESEDAGAERGDRSLGAEGKRPYESEDAGAERGDRSLGADGKRPYDWLSIG
ncbi:MAG: hypothetical protein FJ042_06455 [Candidatus Cloacimonetes bacterium]|nr:hypothetical protein [Candidatus Cloacimonadota bacterium]